MSPQPSRRARQRARGRTVFTFAGEEYDKVEFQPKVGIKAVFDRDLCRCAQCGRCNFGSLVAIEGPTQQMLIVALKQWIVDGTCPPKSAYPPLQAGTLTSAVQVLASSLRIPGQPLPHDVLNPRSIYELGPGFHTNDVSGVAAPRPPGHQRCLARLRPSTQLSIRMVTKSVASMGLFSRPRSAPVSG